MSAGAMSEARTCTAAVGPWTCRTPACRSPTSQTNWERASDADSDDYPLASLDGIRGRVRDELTRSGYRHLTLLEMEVEENYGQSATWREALALD